MKTKFIQGAWLLAGIFTIAGCASQPINFNQNEVIQQLSDRKPTAVPAQKQYNYRQYAIETSARKPLNHAWKLRKSLRSQDVNAFDELVASTWYTPRLAVEKSSAEDWLKGPQEKGPPVAPFYVFKVKTEGTAPGFLIEDARSVKYLIKFDSGNFDGLESTVNFVMNRLHWAWGYHVPEDYIVNLNRSDLKPKEGSKVNSDDINRVLALTMSNATSYRVTASRFLDGKIIGYAPQEGVRKDDVNDIIAHENLRAIRALGVFSSWIHNVSFRSDNWLDVYVDESGEGYVMHYLLDFGEALGVHSANYDQPWESYERYYSWQETLQGAFLLGISKKDFRETEYQMNYPLSYFSSDLYDPAQWKTIFAYIPFLNSLPDDDYWAAKLVARISEADLKFLFEQSGHSDQETIDQYIQTLMLRKEKLLRYYFSQVTPVDFKTLEGNRLILEDQALKFLPQNEEPSYRVEFEDMNGEKLADSKVVSAQQSTLTIDLALEDHDYIRVLVYKEFEGGITSPRAAEFHFSHNAQKNAPQLRGVLH